jgi:hypothetical protein
MSKALSLDFRDRPFVRGRGYSGPPLWRVHRDHPQVAQARRSPPRKLPGNQQKKSGIVWAFIDVLHAASMLLGHRHERLCTVGNSLALRRLAIWAECEGESAPYGEVPSGAAASARV